MDEIVLSDVKQKGEHDAHILMYDYTSLMSSTRPFGDPQTIVSITVRDYVGVDERGSAKSPRGSVIEFYLRGGKLPEGCKVLLKYKSGLLSSLLGRGSVNIGDKDYSIMSWEIMSPNPQGALTEPPLAESPII